MLLRCESLEPPMSQLGQTRSWGDVHRMTVLPPKAEVDLRSSYVAEVPKAAASRCSEQQSYSINSSATASRVGGTVIPNARAVCILMTNSNFVGCNTGMFAGFSPLRTRPT